MLGSLLNKGRDRGYFICLPELSHTHLLQAFGLWNLALRSANHSVLRASDLDFIFGFSGSNLEPCYQHQRSLTCKQNSMALPSGYANYSTKSSFICVPMCLCVCFLSLHPSILFIFLFGEKWLIYLLSYDSGVQMSDISSQIFAEYLTLCPALDSRGIRMSKCSAVRDLPW